MSENFPKLESHPDFLVEREKIEKLGIKPGVYTYNPTGDEYYTIYTTHEMTLKDGKDTLGPERIGYVGLYEHPVYGKYAHWSRPPEEFLEIMTWNRQEP